MDKDKVIDYVMNTPRNTNRQVLEGMLDGAGSGAGLPAVGGEDEGKVLTVVNGEWDKAESSAGYKCTETSTILTEETITTTKFDQSSLSAYASLSYSTPITADEIKLTLNGTEYVLPRKDAGGNNLYQGQDALPNVYSSQNGNNINTQDEGTYALKIETLSLSVETTPYFKEAVKSLMPSIPEDKLFVVQFVRTGDTLTAQTSYADVKKAADDSKYIVGRAVNGSLVFDGVLTGTQDEYGYINYKFGFLNEYGSSNKVEYISVLLKHDGTTETVVRKIAFANE